MTFPGNSKKTKWINYKPVSQTFPDKTEKDCLHFGGASVGCSVLQTMMSHSKSGSEYV